MSVAIQIQGVQHSYGEGAARTQVLFDNALEVQRGELVLMSGPSGSGKTTLLTLVGGLRSVQEGSIEVFGRSLAGLNAAGLRAHRRAVGFVFQGHHLFPALTAEQNVRMALDLLPLTRKEKRARACALLERLGLGERTQHKPSELSGGQKQRVAIARGLVHEPQLVLADEPTAALDEETSRDVVDLFRELVGSGLTVLMVTHDPRIMDVADHVVGMMDGRVVTDVEVRISLQICSFLQNVALFEHHSPAQLTEISQDMQRERVSQDRVLVREGEQGDRFYLIRSGRVRVERNGELVATLGEGGYFGEQALINDSPRNATVTATEPTELYSLNRAQFHEVLRHSPTMEQALRRALYERSTGRF